MKALTNNPKPVQQKTKEERRKLNSEVRNNVLNDTISSKPFVLTQNDYQELIDIKANRITREKNNSQLFFFMGLSLTLAFLLFAFNWKTFDSGMIGELEAMQNAEFDELVEIPLTEQATPPPPTLQQPIVVAIPDEVILEQIKVNMDVEITEDMAIEQVQLSFDDIPVVEEKAEEIFQIVEQNPEPKGGISAFYKFVSENVKYPTAALQQNIEGRVFVKFVVSKTGKINNVQVIKGIGGGCDEEAARIVALSPDWTPGKQRGKEVNVYMMLPITFKLNH